jgi:Spore Coat Protein U domain
MYGGSKLVLQMEFPLYKKVASFAAVLALTSTAAAQAAGTTASLQATLPVQSACNITSTTNFNFAPIPAGALTSTESAAGSLTYACSAVPTGITLSDSGGQAGGFQLQPPSAASGTAPIGFFITGTDSEGDPSAVYLDGLPTNQIGASAKPTDTITFVATLDTGAKGFMVAAGTYTDILTATILFS